VRVLTGAQRELSDRFARVEREIRGIGTSARPGRKSAAAGLRGTFECAAEHRYDAGGHAIVGRGLRLSTSPVREPLLFYQGRYAAIASATAVRCETGITVA
jgi:flavin reductase (DIM6/NTAB) family NADH-FMN oxidoreductase RutF